MENQLITVEEFITTKESLLLVDVRSPLEYKRASIPGAVNIPLFNEEERAQVGIIYKEKGTMEAKMKGVEIVAPKLYSMVQQVREKSQDSSLVFYCWRGGLRSKFLLKIFDFLGFNVFQLKGGYKAYRRFIYKQLADYNLKQKFIVLNGLTGTGKTEIINRLAQQGWPVIDLEGLARHRGSLFGNIGLSAPRSQKDFEAMLWHKLHQFQDEPYIIIEGEGKRIGPIFLPSFMVEGIREGIHVLLQASLKTRTERILKEYGSLAKEVIIEEAQGPIRYLERTLGREKVQILLELLYNGDFYNVVKNLCRDHYDHKYEDSKIDNNVFYLIVDAEDDRQAAQKIDEFVKKLLIKEQTIKV
ncbi:tRNA 2-selenouridine(34) synthase MnmH [Candidatus Contubernalis alkaliaceticus]|uniref:tRNA 2-selenouridine(34) synthase MnmH n=1 Tax=Candidatus Contubernalis alkaliaceticus TaxID=338645 RepID=UPI001F4BD6CE|nr:tRNA 2-selenouridine(34) synthase MnmH [Candidatus Contubernalis alkalaceticus]UNC91528.1 tRNA 2-selenouridine(34) synthase MnmH [Candidatus Contubernalis alkalaceticus]